MDARFCRLKTMRAARCYGISNCRYVSLDAADCWSFCASVAKLLASAARAHLSLPPLASFQFCLATVLPACNHVVTRPRDRQLFELRLVPSTRTDRNEHTDRQTDRQRRTQAQRATPFRYPRDRMRTVSTKRWRDISSSSSSGGGGGGVVSNSIICNFNIISINSTHATLSSPINCYTASLACMCLIA